MFLKLILNILKLQELHNDYPLGPDKIEIKRETLSNYPLKFLIFFDKEKYMIHYENLQLYLRLGLKLKKYIAN